VAAARALRSRGEQVIGVDAGSPPGAAALAHAEVELHLDDPDGIALLDRVGAVVKSPGVPGQTPLIAAARARGMPLLGELELAWRLLPNEFIAVTGTNGKTTTVELIGHIHRQAGVAVAVAGNVGTALSSLVGALAAEATVVCEASSFQLEDTLAFAPEAAVLLNLAADHLDRHRTFAAYAAAKLEAFARQQPEDVAVYPADLGERIGRAQPAPAAGPSHDGVDVNGVDVNVGGAEGDGDGTASSLVPGAAQRIEFGWDAEAAMFELDGELWWQGRALAGLGEMQLRGRHNVENAMAAAAVCLARGIAPASVRAGLASFPGVAHRMEELAELDGVLYVNDSKATNVASTLVALEAFGGHPLHLIVGGQGKGQDFTSLREPVARACAGVYLIGEHAATIAAALANIDPPVLDCGDLERALAAAAEAAASDPDAVASIDGEGPVVLLSPACASFDQFADFEARGDRFRELVENLQG